MKRVKSKVFSVKIAIGETICKDRSIYSQRNYETTKYFLTFLSTSIAADR